PLPMRQALSADLTFGRVFLCSNIWLGFGMVESVKKEIFLGHENVRVIKDFCDPIQLDGFHIDSKAHRGRCGSNEALQRIDVSLSLVVMNLLEHLLHLLHSCVDWKPGSPLLPLWPLEIYLDPL